MRHRLSTFSRFPRLFFSYFTTRWLPLSVEGGWGGWGSSSDDDDSWIGRKMIATDQDWLLFWTRPPAPDPLQSRLSKWGRTFIYLPVLLLLLPSALVKLSGSRLWDCWPMFWCVPFYRPLLHQCRGHWFLAVTLPTPTDVFVLFPPGVSL